MEQSPHPGMSAESGFIQSGLNPRSWVSPVNSSDIIQCMAEIQVKSWQHRLRQMDCQAALRISAYFMLITGKPRTIASQGVTRGEQVYNRTHRVPCYTYPKQTTVASLPPFQDTSGLEVPGRSVACWWWLRNPWPESSHLFPPTDSALLLKISFTSFASLHFRSI